MTMQKGDLLRMSTVSRCIFHYALSSGVLLIFLLLGMLGCSRQSAPVQEEKGTPLHFTIVLGSGGGFAGRYEGYIIDSLGTVSSWQGVTAANAERKEIGRLDSSQRAAIQQMIVGDTLLSITFRQTGNVTSFVTLASGAGEHRFSWTGTNPDEAVPAQIREFYSHLRGSIDALIHKETQ